MSIVVLWDFRSKKKIIVRFSPYASNSFAPSRRGPFRLVFRHSSQTRKGFSMYFLATCIKDICSVCYILLNKLGREVALRSLAIVLFS